MSTLERLDVQEAARRSNGWRGLASLGGSTSRQRWTLVSVLTLTYLLNHADRNIFVVAAPLIQAEFALSDSQLGLLTGAAFALLYSLCGIPLGYLADRTSRRTLLLCSLVVWSALTAATGLATTIIQLALLRIAVGIGEAGCAPASHSLLGQHLTGSQRAFGLAVFGLGAPLGMALAFAAGSLVASEFGWRTAFIALGVLGIPTALYMWMALPPVLDRREASVQPPRTPDPAATADAQAPSLLSQVAGLVKSPAFFALLCADGLLFVAFGAALQWMPVFLHRVHGMSIGELGPWLALAAGAPALFGNLVGGGIAVRWRMDNTSSLLKIALVASLLGLPFLVAALLAGSAAYSLILLAAAFAFVTATTGPNYAAAQELAGPGRRALGAALLLLVANLVGLGIGTPVVGVLSDWLATSLGSVQALRAAICIVAIGAGAASLVAYVVTIRISARGTERASE